MNATQINRLLVSEAVTTGDGVIPFFQPIITKDPKHLCYEVLGRLQVNGTMLNPSQFLPLFEGTALQAAFDSKILTAAILQVATWRKYGTSIHVHVNASTEVLESTEYVPLIQETLAQHHVPASCLTVEILETCRRFWENRKILHTLRELRFTGVQIAIDDFPTCDDPIDLLQWIRLQKGSFHVLKLDRSIVQDACNGTGKKRATAVRSVRGYVEFARKQGMHVVAEGVETTADMDAMWKLGAHELQGFGIGKPTSATQAYHLSHAQCVPASGAANTPLAWQ